MGTLDVPHELQERTQLFTANGLTLLKEAVKGLAKSSQPQPGATARWNSSTFLDRPHRPVIYIDAMKFRLGAVMVSSPSASNDVSNLKRVPSVSGTADVPKRPRLSTPLRICEPSLPSVVACEMDHCYSSGRTEWGNQEVAAANSGSERQEIKSEDPPGRTSSEVQMDMWNIPLTLINEMTRVALRNHFNEKGPLQ